MKLQNGYMSPDTNQDFFSCLGANNEKQKSFLNNHDGNSCYNDQYVFYQNKDQIVHDNNERFSVSDEFSLNFDRSSVNPNLNNDFQTIL